MPDQPLGYFLTWRTHGTWLHGDPRGSVDYRHNAYGTDRLPADSGLVERAASRMRHPAFLLTDAARSQIEQVIVDHCQIRAWTLMEKAARTNHVHVVVGYHGLPPEPMLAQLKAYGTRALRQAGIISPRAHAWAEHGSTQYLWNLEEIEEVCAYVRDGQDVPK